MSEDSRDYEEAERLLAKLISGEITEQERLWVMRFIREHEPLMLTYKNAATGSISDSVTGVIEPEKASEE